MAHSRRGRDSRQGDTMKQGWLPVLVSLGLLLVVASSGCDGNSYEAGLDAFNEGDYTTALNTFRPLAEQGEAQAQFKLGVMYHQGQGVPQDYAEAMKWYRLAAEQGFALAQSNLGGMYISSHGVGQDYQEAAQWFQRAANLFNSKAQFNIGCMYSEGLGLPKDYVLAQLWVSRAAERGFNEAVTLRETW